MRTTVADEHKFSAVRCLSQIFLDRWKNATYLACIWRPVVESFCAIQLESVRYRAALSFLDHMFSRYDTILTFDREREREKDGQTDDSIYRASIAWRG